MSSSHICHWKEQVILDAINVVPHLDKNLNYNTYNRLSAI
jgi:hypothetical protein